MAQSNGGATNHYVTTLDIVNSNAIIECKVNDVQLKCYDMT